MARTRCHVALRPNCDIRRSFSEHTFANDLERTHYGGVAKTAERYVRADDRKRSGPSSRYAASVVSFSGGA